VFGLPLLLSLLHLPTPARAMIVIGDRRFEAFTSAEFGVEGGHGVMGYELCVMRDA
jgi:hypothetical protein